MKISEYPSIATLVGTELVLMDSGTAGNRTTVTATTNTLAAAVAGGSIGTFNTAHGGIVPTSPGGTLAFMRADGTWVGPQSGALKYKTADQDITNNTTLAADAQLQVNLSSGGIYQYDAFIFFTNQTTFAQGLKIAMVFTGTSDIHRAGIQYYDGSLGANIQGAGVFNAPATPGGSLPTAANTEYFYRYLGLIRTTSAGTLQVQTAQQNSNANATRIRQASYLSTQQVI